MELRLIREPTRNDTTFGVLFADGRFHCHTLEDAIRERPGVPVEHWKIKGQTAIPAGRYYVDLTRSNRFQRVLPELMTVPGFTGVRIHSGNTIADTDGCLIVGSGRSSWGITGSRVALERLMGELLQQKDIWITIENPA
jgi:hypothetical protein